MKSVLLISIVLNLMQARRTLDEHELYLSEFLSSMQISNSFIVVGTSGAGYIKLEGVGIKREM